VNVGDSVTWTNSGPSDHTATASDGSFDTGTLSKGRSASHTFGNAGTFAYVCSIHPNMHGTVRVVGSSSNGGNQGGSAPSGDSGSSSGSSSSSPSSSGTSGSSASLPATGVDAGGLMVVGLGFLALGAFARRRTVS
jgi:LPXTG-motif cell wall-anchored protein